MNSALVKKILVGLLYALPVVFFVVCYFCITATEEDILQGAGTTPDVWHDLIAAFNNNARLADMYAWAVINFFDYQYKFGFDTILRIIDAVAAIGMLVLLVRVILSRRPRLDLRDGLVYAGVFLIIFVTPFGYTFYRGFSMIHNYLIISLAMLGFCLPFIRKVSGGTVSFLYKKWWFAIPMGLVFGLSANFPPLAFLATYIVVKIGQVVWARSKQQSLDGIMPERWEWMMILAMLVSMATGYLLGPGVSGYAADPVYTVSYDYVAFGDTWQNFGGSVMRIVKHIAVNFGRTLLPALIIVAVLWCIAWIRAGITKSRVKVLPEKPEERRMILAIVIFAAFVVLAGSQIIMPVRLCLPAYLGLTVVIAVLARNWFDGIKIGGILAASTALCVGMLIVIGLRTFFALDFHARAGKALNKIENSRAETVCIDIDEATQRFKTPFNIFQQEETFVPRRTTPIVIYGKNVVHCEK